MTILVSASPSAAEELALLDRIASNPEICGGRPCIRGTRMRVSDILDMVGGGMSFEEILADFDYLESDDLKAALSYASHAVDRPLEQAA